MGIDYQLDRAWANAAKGLRQCQKAEKALESGRTDAASDHFAKAGDKFGTAVDHLLKADDDAYKKAGSLLDDCNKQLQKAADAFLDGNDASAANHYDKALDKFDEALDLVG
jgi:hypothetical protein